MRRYFVSVYGQVPGGTMVLLEPIFNLDDQLAAAAGSGDRTASAT